MKRKRQYHTDFLFPNSGFLMGAGSVFNIAGNYFEFNYSSADQNADEKAISNDWGVIGEDLAAIMSAFDQKGEAVLR